MTDGRVRVVRRRSEHAVDAEVGRLVTFISLGAFRVRRYRVALFHVKHPTQGSPRGWGSEEPRGGNRMTPWRPRSNHQRLPCRPSVPCPAGVDSGCLRETRPELGGSFWLWCDSPALESNPTWNSTPRAREGGQERGRGVREESSGARRVVAVPTNERRPDGSNAVSRLTDSGAVWL